MLFRLLNTNYNLCKTEVPQLYFAALMTYLHEKDILQYFWPPLFRV